jgi:hypothetical protein
MKIDWTGSKYLGLNLHWGYKNRHVDISMLEYIDRVLERFAHPHHSTVQLEAPPTNYWIIIILCKDGG